MTGMDKTEYKFFIDKLRADFDSHYPDLRLNGKSYNGYVFNFIQRSINEALEQFSEKSL